MPQPKDSAGTNQLEEAKQQDDEELAAPKKRQKIWPCRESDSWCPPSTSITNFSKGTLHSCSDKLCRWNCLGMQGSLLMSVLDEPLYMTTLTVGRKFSRAICQRAVCCRADGFGTRKTAQAGCAETVRDVFGKYKLNHPTLMETNVYMDESGKLELRAVSVHQLLRPTLP